MYIYIYYYIILLYYYIILYYIILYYIILYYILCIIYYIILYIILYYIILYYIILYYIYYIILYYIILYHIILYYIILYYIIYIYTYTYNYIYYILYIRTKHSRPLWPLCNMEMGRTYNKNHLRWDQILKMTTSSVVPMIRLNLWAQYGSQTSTTSSSLKKTRVPESRPVAMCIAKPMVSYQKPPCLSMMLGPSWTHGPPHENGLRYPKID